MDKEIFKPLYSANVNRNRYEISNYGNIYDKETNKYVTQYHRKDGYVSVSLESTNGTKVCKLVHILVAENFIPFKLLAQTQVNHLDGIKHHNEIDNLEWSTPKENTQHAFRTGLADNNIGENSHLSKLSNDDVKRICELLSEGKRYKEILQIMSMEITDNNLDMIGNIYRRIAWTRISSNYNFPEYDDRFRANSKNTIEKICEYIEQGFDNKEVYEKVFGKPLNRTRDDKVNYELIRMIRTKQSFTDISSKYNF